ncbi:MAG: site-2 protease family protein [Firmicutes bacterium]|nr:site-2 protease family protein [Bacillota bacterium]
MMVFIYIVLAILILMFMITVHELGHYLAAKILKIRVTEFSIGFGKALFKRTSKKTGEVFAIRMIPLGGYCAFEDEDAAGSGLSNKEGHGDGAVGDRNRFNEDGQELSLKPSDGKMSYTEAHPWRRLIVLFSGALFNFLCAVIFSVILLMVVGYNHGIRIDRFSPESPNFAQRTLLHTEGDYIGQPVLDSNNDPIMVAGTGNLLEGDVILAVRSYNSTNSRDFTLLRSSGEVLGQFGAGTVVRLDIRRVVNGERIYFRGEDAIEATIVNIGGRTGLGIDRVIRVDIPLGFGRALGQAWLFAFELAWFILTFLWQLVTGGIGLSSIGGPMTTVTVMAESVGASLLNILILIPLISVNLAVFNLLPFPALDGMRMVFTGIEWIRGKPINPELEGKIHIIGFIILLGFVLLADINFLFNGGRGMLEMFGRWNL